MNWIVALGAEAGLCLAYFGGPWFTVGGMVRQPLRAVSVPLVAAVRLIMSRIGLGILSRQGADSAQEALGGLGHSHLYLLERLGGNRHGR